MSSNNYNSYNRPRARSSYSSSSNHYHQPPPPLPPAAAAAATAPSAGPSHGSLLASTPRRGFDYFPQFVGVEGGSRTYSDARVHHVWNSGNVNTHHHTHSLFFFYFLFCVCVCVCFRLSPAPPSRSSTRSTLSFAQRGRCPSRKNSSRRLSSLPLGQGGQRSR